MDYGTGYCHNHGYIDLKTFGVKKKIILMFYGLPVNSFGIFFQLCVF